MSKKSDAKQRSHKWYWAHREVAAKREGNCRFKREYGLTAEQYEMIKKAQGNLCGVCKKPMNKILKSGNDPVLDHDHETGRYREFIHRKCNKALGLLKEDSVTFRLAAEYLERHGR